MEYIDIFDANRNLVRTRVPRDEYIFAEDWFLAAHLWVIDSQNRLLMQRRSAQKKGSPNAWDITVAGHVMSGEDPRSSIVREAQEELGLTINPTELEVAGEFAHQDHHYFITSFLLKADIDKDTLVLQPEEVSEMRWFTMAEIKERLEKQEGDFLRRKEELTAILEKFS